jgi:hypothetical protein
MINNDKYKNGKIYIIRCYKTEDNDFIAIPNYCYVGSTCAPLYKRFYMHKQFAFNETKYKSKLYECMRNTFHLYDHIWKIELYEEFPCDNIEQLLKKEGEVIRLLKPFLNSNIPGSKEKTEEEKQIIKDKTKERIKNKLEINTDFKIIVEEIKNKIGFENDLIITREQINNCTEILKNNRDIIYDSLCIYQQKRGIKELNFKTTLELINSLYKFYNKKLIGNKEMYNKSNKTYLNYLIKDIV